MQYSAIFNGCKNDNFQMKNFDFFFSFASNIDRWYTLEPPQLGDSNDLCFRAKIRKFVYLFINKFLSTYIDIQVHIHMRQGLGLG